MCLSCGGCADLTVAGPPSAGERERVRFPHDPHPSRGGREPRVRERAPEWIREPVRERVPEWMREPVRVRAPGAAPKNYVVRLREGVSAEEFARRHGLTVQRAMRSDPSTIIFRGRDAPGVLGRLQSDPAVIWAEPDAASQNVPMTR